MLNFFTYGTFRKGFERHPLIESCEFLGEMKIHGFKMVDLGPYPGIIHQLGSAIVAEAYRISPETLKMIDHIEGYTPENETGCIYLGRKIYATVPNSSPTELLEGVSYVLNSDIYNFSKCEVVEDGDWLKHLERKINAGEFPLKFAGIPDQLQDAAYGYVYKQAFNMFKKMTEESI